MEGLLSAAWSEPGTDKTTRPPTETDMKSEKGNARDEILLAVLRGDTMSDILLSPVSMLCEGEDEEEKIISIKRLSLIRTRTPGQRSLSLTLGTILYWTVSDGVTNLAPLGLVLRGDAPCIAADPLWRPQFHPLHSEHISSIYSPKLP